VIVPPVFLPLSAMRALLNKEVSKWPEAHLADHRARPATPTVLPQGPQPPTASSASREQSDASPAAQSPVFSTGLNAASSASASPVEARGTEGRGYVR
jgi:hypothetical protein